MNKKREGDEALWRRIVMTALWGAHGLINFLPAILLFGIHDPRSLGAVIGAGLFGVLILIAQVFMLRGWIRRLFTLAIGGLLVWCVVMAGHHGLVGDPTLTQVFATTYYLALIASLFVIWKPRMWMILAGAASLAIFIVPLVVGLMMQRGQIPRTVMARDDVAYMDIVWFGGEENPVVGTWLVRMQKANPDGSKPPEYFQVIGDSVTTFELPRNLWVPSRPWDGKIALGSMNAPSLNDEDELATHVRTFDADGNMQIVEDIPPSSASAGAMLTGWTYGSEDSPWLLIPVSQRGENTSYDPVRHAIHARHSETAETHLLEGLTTMLFAEWENPDTMLIARLIPLEVESEEDTGGEEDIDPDMDPLDAFEFDEEAGEFTGDLEDFETFLALTSGDATPMKPYRAELLRVHVPTDTREVIAEGMIEDLSRVMHLSGDERLIFLTDVSDEIGILSWKTGEMAFPAPMLIPGSLGVSETTRGFRMVFQEFPDDDTSLFHMHDGREIIHSLKLPGDSKVFGTQISPDGGKVLFRRDAAPMDYGYEFPSLTVEIWDVDHDEVTVLSQRPFIMSILESMQIIEFYHWHRNPWRPDGRAVAVPITGLRWPINANFVSEMTLFHYEDWAEEKWGARVAGGRHE
jgi:hypothetical protein